MAGPVLRYDLMSRALLFCFLAPFLFLGIAQVTVAIGHFQTPSQEVEKKPVVMPLNPIDKALGAPAPDVPKDDDSDKSKDKDKDKDKLSPTAAYVFASFFAILYVVGRILEAWLVRSLFRKVLLGSETTLGVATN